jgi:HD-like signal output (HDOD) protein
MEEAVLGISHSEIGSILSKKWGLPEFLHESIEFHHSPLSASMTNVDLVSIVYIANILCGIENKNYNYYFFSEDVLEKFNFSDEKKFTLFHKDLKKLYTEHKKLIDKII